MTDLWALQPSSSTGSIRTSLTVVPKIVVRHLFRRNQSVVFFSGDLDSVIGLFELEQGNHAVLHELGSNWAADQSGKLLFTHTEVLLDLHDV